MCIRDRVTLAFFGDSASNEGTFHESVNMAAAWNLPVVYIIENNLFGISVDIRRVTKEHDLYKRAPGYGIPGELSLIHILSVDDIPWFG